MYNTVGGFDENYPMIEDYPFDYKVLEAGYEFFLLEKVCVNYRVNFDSVTRPLNHNKFVNIDSHNQAAKFIRLNTKPGLLKNKMYLWYFLRASKLLLIDKIVKNGNNINAKKNYIYKKLLFVNKYVSNKLRIFQNIN